MYYTLAKQAKEAMNSKDSLTTIRLPDLDAVNERSTQGGDLIHRSVSKSDIAYLHHTSGTSTGLPKPIPQSHHGAVGVLPSLLNGPSNATFTTTPLYHGGVADCFRSWSSGAMIWLFPGREAAITSGNIQKSLSIAQSASQLRGGPFVKYFSSVPYILQMLADEDDALKALRSMNMVGVGGAALPQSVGDDLVRKGINLISRFGSAECGFLMSSQRDFSKDMEWQYLRDLGTQSLSFEQQGNGLYELIIGKDWPHMAKTNRDDGSFATSDLFEPHPTISGAWKYHSRSDSQLTLITGKKFDPAPLEDNIATLNFLSDVMIFGNGQQVPGGLLFRSTLSNEMSDEEVLDQVWPSIKKLNAEGQAHTRISRAMLRVMPASTPSLEKSSKGTILRGQAEKRYASYIAQAYEGLESDEQAAEYVHVPEEQVHRHVLEIVKQVTNILHIGEQADLFSMGVDSVACMRIRKLLQRVRAVLLNSVSEQN